MIYVTIAPNANPPGAVGHLDDRNTIADHREYCLVPLLHDAQLQQHAWEVSRIRRSPCNASPGAA
jgi:hypothetical protein